MESFPKLIWHIIVSFLENKDILNLLLTSNVINKALDDDFFKTLLDSTFVHNYTITEPKYQYLLFNSFKLYIMYKYSKINRFFNRMGRFYINPNFCKYYEVALYRYPDIIRSLPHRKDEMWDMRYGYYTKVKIEGTITYDEHCDKYTWRVDWGIDESEKLDLSISKNSISVSVENGMYIIEPNVTLLIYHRFRFYDVNVSTLGECIGGMNNNSIIYLSTPEVYNSFKTVFNL